MPWLRLSAELNPNDIRTYTVTAYWLRERMGKVAEAEQFLREGLRENPDSYEIMYELGRVYAENRHDETHARNLWRAALREWEKQEGPKADPDKFMFVEIAAHLALLEEKQGHHREALAYMEQWKARSPNPAAVEKYIEEVRRKMISADQTHADQPSQTPGKVP